MKYSLLQSLSPIWGRLAGRDVFGIGFQMGLETMYLVQMQAGASGVAFLAAASLHYGCSLDEMLADPRRLKALLGRAMDEQPFRGRRVVTCMPSDQIKTFVVSYAVAEGQQDADAIMRDLRGRVDGNADGMVFDFMPIRQPGADSPRKEALVAIAAKDRVVAYLDVLSRAGLEVAAVDIGPIALTRVVSRISAGADGQFQNLLLINFGTLGSFLTVVWGRRLMLDRPIEFAEKRLLSRLQTVMDLPEPMAKQLLLERGFVAAPGADASAEIGAALKEILHPEFMALKDEVARTLIYTASKTRGKTVDKIYLVGSVARYPGIAELLCEVLTMPIEVLDPFSIFPHRLEHIAELGPHTGAAVATGLALRGVPA